MVIGNDSWKIAGHDIFLDLGSLLCLSAAVTNASRCILHVSGIFFMLTHFLMHFARCITVLFPCHACVGVSGVLRVALLFSFALVFVISYLGGLVRFLFLFGHLYWLFVPWRFLMFLCRRYI